MRIIKKITESYGNLGFGKARGQAVRVPIANELDEPTHREQYTENTNGVKRLVCGGRPVTSGGSAGPLFDGGASELWRAKGQFDDEKRRAKYSRTPDRTKRTAPTYSHKRPFLRCFS